MQFKNKALQAIFDNVVSPAMKTIRHSVDGHVVGVDYHSQTVDVYWKEPGSMTGKTSKKVPLPKDGDGVFRQGVKIGDKVSMNFRNGDIRHPYVTTIYKKTSTESNYQSKYGASIPKGIGYF